MPQGDTLNFSCYVDWGQAATVYPLPPQKKKKSEVSGIPQEIIES